MTRVTGVSRRWPGGSPGGWICSLQVQELTLLDGGVEAFPRMVEAIEQARASVILEMYLFRLDATGRRFVAALSAAAARGVEVRVALDGWGSSRDAREIEAALTAAGCAVRIHAW